MAVFTAANEVKQEHRDGNRLIIEPISPKGLLVMSAEVTPLEENFPDIDTGAG